jgi:hypothetical protein
MNTLWHDVRFGARMLAKNPGFTVVAVLTLALGVGTILSVVYAALLRPLPYPEPYRLVRVWQVDSQGAESNLSALLPPCPAGHAGRSRGGAAL